MEHKWQIDMFDGVNYQTWNTIIEIFSLRNICGVILMELH
jgi:hypothetical protein